MTVATLRRFRADRLLREEFERLRERVLASVRARLAAVGVKLDRSDLEACYAQAWQGLYAAMLSGQEVANPTGWLALTTYRRAIDEHRARARFPVAESQPGEGHELDQRDLASELDDRRRLRELMEALRTRLSEREREAAALCYLQGMTRAEAAARLGLSAKAMQKLMEGRSPERPGVAAKVGALVTAISAGSWCDEQASLMRALAFGVLAPGGERHQLALLHQRECPACRTYVAALRGVAVALPPVLTPLWLGGGALAGGGAAGSAAGAGSASAVSGSASAAGAGTASGGWLAGGTVATKLAAGCLLVLGVGAGCVAIAPRASQRAAGSPPPVPRGAVTSVTLRPAPAPATTAARQLVTVPSTRAEAKPPSPRAASRRGTLASGPAQAAREFTPEQARSSVPRAPTPDGPNSGPASSPAIKGPPSPGAAATMAAREFSPG